MATTEYAVNHPLAVKVWSRRLMQEALKETYASRFMSDSKDSLIYVKNDLKKGPGDRITVGLRVQLAANGVTGDATLEGQEEALSTFTDNLFIDQLRHAVRSGGEMSQQRVPFSIREEALEGLRDWISDKIDTGFFNQIAGNTGVTTASMLGMQSAATAPTGTGGANARIILGGAQASEASLSSSGSADDFQLTLIDRAVNLAKIATPMIRPIRVNGQPKYVAFLHPNQVRSMKTDATTARVTWYDTQKARVQGGETDNPIYNGALGEYNGVIIHESTRVPASPDNANARRAILCGAQAACLATGRRDSETQMKWTEELFDYENQLGVSIAYIWGLKKAVFNSVDFGTIVISTFASNP